MNDPRIAALRRWYRAHKRDLPWRHTRDPYRILVSEMMLQQTQVTRGLLFYARWLERFPSWQALARAKTATILRAWAGLGYNRRALQLRDIARHVVAYGIPQTAQAWQQLKGIGPYTAAAVHAFSRHERVIMVDTNIRRVAGRLLLGIPFPDQRKDESLRRVLDRVTPRGRCSWDLPQAFMDFGSMVCTSTKPACQSCPLKPFCMAGGKMERAKQITRTNTERRHPGKAYPDRIYRGRILRIVRETGAQRIGTLGSRIDETFVRRTDGIWLRAMVQRLAKDGLVTETRDVIRLPRT